MKNRVKISVTSECMVSTLQKKKRSVLFFLRAGCGVIEKDFIFGHLKFEVPVEYPGKDW